MRHEESFAGRVTRLGALADPVRRALYRFVAAQQEPVSRDQAADGVEVPRHTAKHHLDRLVEEGLLVTEFRRLTGRTGPGAGRPAKLYRRADTELAVSLPHRRYDLAGAVLADAVERSLAGTPLLDAVHDAAAAAGERIAGETPPAEPEAPPLDRLSRALTPHGYEPREEGPDEPAAGHEHRLVLGNCPFDQLAADHAELICGMNLSFVDAVADGIGCSRLRAVLDPDPARCCVTVHDPDRP
jgi:predicted ArsR family transcriptional regulator